MRRFALCGLLALVLASCDKGAGFPDAALDAPSADTPADLLPDVPDASPTDLAPEAAPDAPADLPPDAPGTGIAVIAPSTIAFGQIPFGCFSKSNELCVVNTGTAPLDWTGLSMDACSTPEFKAKAGLPATILPGGKACIHIVFAPQEVGKKACDAVVQVGHPAQDAGTVHLSAESTAGLEVTDTFKQVSGQEVDALFVLDDSPSMCEHLPALQAAIQGFIDHGNLLQTNYVDYHVGVVSADSAKARLGRLNGGSETVAPLWLQTGRDDLTRLAEIANLGCAGSVDGTESGLAAALAAVTGPLVADTDVPCISDASCRANPTVCPDPASCPFLCQGAGTCSGWNAGFLRQYAQLEFYLVTDQPDHDPRTVEFFADAFKNIKGYYNTGMMHVNAVVEPPGGCTAGADTPIPADDRYAQVVKETQGRLGSLCDENWGLAWNQIGQVAFHLKIQYFLTRLAEPSSVKVFVDGQECLDGWKYDAPSNSIIFDQKGACIPGMGQEVRVTYNTLCLTS